MFSNSIQKHSETLGALQNVSREFSETEVQRSPFISIFSHVIGLEKTQFFLLFNILILVSPAMSAVCSEFSPPLYLSATEFPLIDGKTVSAQIQSEMNLGFMK